MAKKKYGLTCRDCGAKFESVDPQVRVCKACIKKEESRVVPKSSKPISEMLR